MARRSRPPVTQDSTEADMSSGLDKRIELALVAGGTPGRADQAQEVHHPSAFPADRLPNPLARPSHPTSSAADRSPFRQPSARGARRRPPSGDDNGGGWCA